MIINREVWLVGAAEGSARGQDHPVIFVDVPLSLLRCRSDITSQLERESCARSSDEFGKAARGAAMLLLPCDFGRAACCWSGNTRLGAYVMILRARCVDAGARTFVSVVGIAFGCYCLTVAPSSRLAVES